MTIETEIAKLEDTQKEKAKETLEKLKNAGTTTFVGGGSLPTLTRSEFQALESDVFTKAMEDAKDLDDKYRIKPNENFIGMSYGDILAAWNNWIFSSHPYYDGGNILFLRGNMGYYSDPNAFLDMSSFSGSAQRISYGTAVFIPIITCQWNIGDYYEGKRIEDENSMRHAVRDYIHGGGPMWATIRNTKNNVLSRILPENKYTEYYVESPRFLLDVSPMSTLRMQTDDPLEPGQYDAVIGGYCVLLQNLDGDTTYRIRFGGKGRRAYYTDAVYDVTVVGDENASKKLSSVIDISKDRHPDQFLLRKYVNQIQTVEQLEQVEQKKPFEQKKP